MTVKVRTKEDLEKKSTPLVGEVPSQIEKSAPKESKQSLEDLPDIDDEKVEKKVAEILAKYGLSERQQRESRRETVILQPDAADILKEPNHYFVYSTDFKLWSYKLRGVEVPTPYNRPVKFVKLYRYEVPRTGGKGTETLSVAIAIIWSKKESDYIENCPFFGTKIYKSLKTASMADKEFSEKKTQIKSSIDRLDDAQILRECNYAGLTVSENLAENKNILLMHRINNAVALQKENTKRVSTLEIMTPTDKDPEELKKQGPRETLA